MKSFQAVSDAKDHQKKRLNFYDSIKPAFGISRVFGLLMFRIRTNPNGQIEKVDVDAIHSIWFVASITLNLILFYFLENSPRSKVGHDSTSLILLVDQFVWISQLLMCLVSIILSMINRHRFSKIVQDVMIFDKNVKIEFAPFGKK